jgi:hypothetical protein
MSLVDQAPAQRLEHWLDEGLFKRLLPAVLFDARALGPPQVGKLAQDFGRVVR